MCKYKLKTGKISDAVTGAYQKVENAFVGTFLETDEEGRPTGGLKTGKIGDAVIDAYKSIEETVVGGYKKVEDAFVDAFLEKADAPADEGQDTEQGE